jgi:hypothetical protein
VNSITNVHKSLLDPQEALVNISDTVHNTPDPQETLANISNTGYSTPDPQDNLANISDTCHRLTAHRVVNSITNVH